MDTLRNNAFEVLNNYILTLKLASKCIDDMQLDLARWGHSKEEFPLVDITALYGLGASVYNIDESIAYLTHFKEKWENEE